MKNNIIKYILAFGTIISIICLLFTSPKEDGLYFFIFLCITIILSCALIYISKKETFAKINNFSLNEEKNYFRELIEKYSISELSYLDEFALTNPKDIISVLLKLEKDNIIEIKENKIFIKEVNTDKLKKSEKYLLDNIKDGLLVLDDDLHYIKIVEKECEENGLIEKISLENNYKQYYYEMEDQIKLYGFLFIIEIILVIAIPKVDYILNLIIGTLFIIILIILLLSPVLLFVKAIMKSGKIMFRHHLLPDGKEIFQKLEGLKRFLKEFSNIENETSKSIKLWDDYLIYSVLFNINKNIIKEYSKLIKINYCFTPEELVELELEKSEFYRDKYRNN